MPIDLTDDMMTAINNALTDRAPCLVATAAGDGTPDLSYRGSMIAFDREHLAFWERAKGETLRNLQENPRVAVLYVNRERQQNWRFYGEAQILRDGPVREQIMERVHPFELGQDPERNGYAVLIRIDRIRARSEMIQSRET